MTSPTLGLSVLAVISLYALQAPDASTSFVPNVPDLTLRLHSTTEAGGVLDLETTRTLYFQGAKQRQESVVERGTLVGVTGQVPGGAPASRERTPVVTVTLCDERKQLIFDDSNRQYAFKPLYDPSEYFKGAREGRSTAPSADRPPADGGSTTVTDSVDTGERRNIGPYVARHIKTSRRTEYRSGAASQVTTEERDGWYVDLPVDCFDWAARIALYDTTPGNPNAHMILRGDGRRGYPVEEIIRSPNLRTRNGVAIVTTSRTQLMEVSTRALDASLFSIPSGYRQVLPR
jgi:hypothetical protein